DNLKENLDNADAAAASIKKNIDEYIAQHQIQAPTEPPYQSVWSPSESLLTLDYQKANIKSLIWCLGFDTNFTWLEVPVFNPQGEPEHERGVTGVKGLYFIGLPWLYTWGSGRFSGVAQDARYLADCIAACPLY
ncbi:MAG: hypothetical protein RLZZ148_2222, partial [Cyanobacteriota bacterium]